tara:strand:- start:767 stop:1183 length:417 start_codon:yes stop_codon:yes gene_type:complete
MTKVILDIKLPNEKIILDIKKEDIKQPYFLKYYTDNTIKVIVSSFLKNKNWSITENDVNYNHIFKNNSIKINHIEYLKVKKMWPVSTPFYWEHKFNFYKNDCFLDIMNIHFENNNFKNIMETLTNIKTNNNNIFIKEV